MKKDKTKITFPFEPSERVKEAFRNDAQFQRSLELMTQALFKVSAKLPNVWAIVREEHPELKVYTGTITYDYLTDAFRLVEKGQ